MQTSRFHRILVVADEASEAHVLHTTIRSRAPDPGRVRVLLVAPALNSRFRHWLSDEDEARRAAEGRLRRSLDLLDEAEIRAEGIVGDADPLQAIEDALRIFPANEIIVATRPEGHSNRPARGLVERARRRFAQPILHVVAEPPGARAARLRSSSGGLNRRVGVDARSDLNPGNQPGAGGHWTSAASGRVNESPVGRQPTRS